KRLMRETWEKAGVPVPRFRRVGSEEDLHRAFRELTPPLLLKPAWGAGSIGQIVLNDGSDVASAWAAICDAQARSAESGYAELYAADAARALLVEAVVAGSTSGWDAG